MSSLSQLCFSGLAHLSLVVTKILKNFPVFNSIFPKHFAIFSLFASKYTFDNVFYILYTLNMTHNRFSKRF